MIFQFSQNTDEHDLSGRGMAEHQAVIQWLGEDKFSKSIIEIANSLEGITIEDADMGLKFTISASTIKDLRGKVDSFLAECAIIEQG